MKKSYKKLLFFQIILYLIILLNSFISNVLVKYNLVLFLIVIFVLFKYIFGFEKGKHRYIKDIIFELLIIIFLSFLLYYLSGLFIGFGKVNNYYTWYGINTFILPRILSIVFKEILRYNMLKKSEGNNILIVTTTILFILVDLINYLSISTFSSARSIFLFIALNLLPTISTNIVCTYISIKVGYIPNIIWLLVLRLYYYLLPIVPNYSEYMMSLIRILFPAILGYRLFHFFQKDKIKIDNVNEKKSNPLYLIFSIAFIFILIYFTSGYFKYQSFAIGSGSMLPNINIGDVVVVEKNKNIKENDIIAYKYNNVIIVHRVVKIEQVENDIYYYTKGDANESIDNYIVYSDKIIGVVRLTIPLLGKPAVWLSKL